MRLKSHPQSVVDEVEVLNIENTVYTVYKK